LHESGRIQSGDLKKSLGNRSTEEPTLPGKTAAAAMAGLLPTLEVKISI
jgi:hypothetical protein